MSEPESSNPSEAQERAEHFVKSLGWLVLFVGLYGLLMVAVMGFAFGMAFSEVKGGSSKKAAVLQHENNAPDPVTIPATFASFETTASSASPVTFANGMTEAACPPDVGSGKNSIDATWILGGTFAGILGLTVFVLVTAVGLIRKKHFARKAYLALGSVTIMLIAVSLGVAAYFLLTTTVSDSAASSTTVVFMVFELAGVLFATLLFWTLSRMMSPAVKDYFEGP